MTGKQRKDAETLRREEAEVASLAPSRPGGIAMNDSLIEELASDQFKSIGAPIKRSCLNSMPALDI